MALYNGVFNEKSLLDDVEATWGQHGAHADVLRELIRRAGPLMTDADKLRYANELAASLGPNHKIEAIKQYRSKVLGVGLYEAKQAMDAAYDRLASEETTYKIIRFYQYGPSEVIRTGLTLEEAQAHCRREDTHGVGWFDGYDEEN